MIRLIHNIAGGKNILSIQTLGFLLTITFLFFSSTALAQNGGFAGASNRIGFSARGMGMANTMAATTSEGSYAYYNPAQAALLSKTKQVDITVGALTFDRIFQATGAQFQLPPTAGLAFTLIRTGVKGIDGRTQSGYPTGSFDASEYQLGSSFGIRLSNKMNVGIGLKFSLANYHPELENPVSVGVDLGLLYHVGKHLNIGFSVKDLFANYSWNSQELYNLDRAQNVVNQFPARIVWGLAYQTEKLTLAGDFEIQVYKSEVSENEVFVSEGLPVVITNSETISTSAAQLRLGGSWQAHERVTLRAGWQLPDMTNSDSWGLSSGFSVHLPFDLFSPSIDYAFVMEPHRISNMHVFSLRLNL